MTIHAAEKVSLSIEGNDNFSQRRLKRVLSLKMPGHKFNGDSLGTAIMRLETFYRQSGFVNCRAEYMIDSMTTSGTLNLRLMINEGSKFYVGRIEFTGNRKIASEKLKKVIANRIGKALNYEALGQDDFNLMLFYADYGYIYAEVDHSLEFGNSHKVTVKYHITEGEQVSVSNIILQGNIKVKDRFILNSLTIAPGELFSRSEMIKSQIQLNSTDLFEAVEVSPGEIDTLDNNININVLMTEKPRRMLEASFGYGSGDAIRLMAKWAHRNLLGMGRRIEYNGLVSFRTRFPLEMVRGRSQISYEDPSFYRIGYPVRSEAYYDDFRPSYTDYRLETVGFNLILNTPLSKLLNVGYSWKQEWLKLSPNWQLSKYSADTLSYQGRRSFSVTTTLDRLDDPVNPKKGISLDIELEYTGGIMGGSETYQRAVNNWNFYAKLPWRRISFAGRFRYGIIGDWSQRSTIPGYEMFFLGGPTTVRGYAYNSISPSSITGAAIGGRIMALINMQTVINLGKNWGTAVFLDGGMLSNESFKKQSLGDMVSSPGLGIRYNLPFGTGRMDLAAPGTLMDRIKYWRWMIAWGEPF
jgi:outer membrane protein insertion porin family